MVEKKKNQWDGKSRGGKAGYSFFILIIRTFGIGCAYCFLAFIVVYFIPFAPKATRAIWRYNRKIRKLGIFRSVTELYCHYYLFGQTIIDKVAMKGGLAGKYEYRFDNIERFLELLDSGKGLIMIGAHVGCWEAGAGFFGKYGKKINIVMLDAEYDKIKEVIEDNSVKENNYKIIAVNGDPIETMVKMKIALDNGEYLCFNGDRYINGDNVCETGFMGETAVLPAGPFKIASRFRVPVVFYYAMREPHRTYRFHFIEPSAVGKQAEKELVEQYVQSLETIVERYPRQWFNFYDFWNNNPDI